MHILYSLCKAILLLLLLLASEHVLKLQDVLNALDLALNACDFFGNISRA